MDSTEKLFLGSSSSWILEMFYKLKRMSRNGAYGKWTGPRKLSSTPDVFLGSGATGQWSFHGMPFFRVMFPASRSSVLLLTTETTILPGRNILEESM